MTPEAPSPWLVDNRDLLPPVVAGRDAPLALDLACGRGRHARWLAEAGYRVEALDRNEDVLADVERWATETGVPVATRLIDFEQPGVTLGRARYDLIVVFRYLHRPLFPAIREALRSGGVLVYETFTTAQAQRGKPTNPAFLLEPGELLALVSPLEVLRQREGDVDGAMLSGVVARSTRVAPGPRTRHRAAGP